MSRSTDYISEADGDAKSICDEYFDQLLEDYINDGECSDDLNNNYGSGDSFFHESFVDKDYDLQESAEILDQLRRYEETDSGLWEGRPPREAIAAQAAYTYGNAVYCLWREIIKEINGDDTLEELREEYEGVEEAMEEEMPGCSDEPDYDIELSGRQAALRSRIEARLKEVIKA